MNLNDFLAHVSSGKKVLSGSEEHRYMTKLAFEAMKITSVINQGFHAVSYTHLDVYKRQASLLR